MHIPTILWAALAAISATKLSAQCATDWHGPQLGFGVSGAVYAFADWDPDGAGAAPANVVVVGGFTVAGDLAVNNCALYNPQSESWTPMDSGTNGFINEAVTLANGDVVVVGGFTEAGGVAASGVARWDGAWHAVGTGIAQLPDVQVLAVAELPNGDLVVGGQFSQAGGVAARSVARWDGLAWHALGAGVSRGAFDARVESLAVMGNGQVVAAGAMTAAGGVAVPGYAAWDGTTWRALPPLPAPVARPFDLTVRANGDLVLMGRINGPPEPNVWQLGSGGWVAVGESLGLGGGSIEATANGQLIVAGVSLYPKVLLWDGSTWTQLGVGGLFQIPFAIHPLPGGAAQDLAIGGYMAVFEGLPQHSLTKLQGGAWSSSTAASSDGVRDFASGADGSFYGAGSFLEIGGVPALRVAQLVDGTWRSLGGGLNGDVEVIAVMPNGDLIASGVFTLAGTASVAGWARWDGTVWSAFSGPGSPADELLVLSDGRLAASAKGLQIWDGLRWQDAGGLAGVRAIAELPSGNIVALSAGFAGGGMVGIWNGQAWTAIDPNEQLSSVWDLAVLPNGDVVAAGILANSGDVIARWDGSGWLPMSTGLDGYAAELTVLPDGDLVATGVRKPGGLGLSSSVARWDGQAWTTIPGGVGLVPRAVGVGPAGSLFLAANLSLLNLQDLWVLSTDCLAAAAPAGSGCAGSGGASLLGAHQWPHLDALYVAHATELPASGFVANVIGFHNTVTSLAGLAPGAPPGCTLFAQPDVLDLLAIDSGTARYELDIPNVSVLVGQSFYHQMLPVEVDALGGLQTTASNALQLTIGDF